MRNIFVAAFCLVYTLASAQMGYGKFEDILEVQQKPLLVVLESPKANTLKDLKKKPADLAKYPDDIAQYNTALKAAFASTWTFSKDVQFVSEEQYEAIKNDKTKKDKYAYFNNKIRRYGYGIKGAFVPNTFYHELGLTDQGKPVYSFMFDTTHPNEADLTFILQQFQSYLLARMQIKGGEKTRKELMAELEQKAALLKGKTLLLDEEFMEQKMLNKISDVYKYKYKISNKAEIDKAILSHNAEYAYIKSVPAVQMISKDANGMKMGDTKYIQYVVNAENGEMLTYVAPAAMQLPGVGGSNMTTTLNDLKKIIKNIENN